jgi:subtilisin-like proprotein convertase family protein
VNLVRLDDGGRDRDHCPGSTISGTFSPNNPLTPFDGMDINGSWTLFASDNAGGDTGTIDQWCLHYSTLPEDMPFLDGFETNDTSRWSSTIP